MTAWRTARAVLLVASMAAAQSAAAVTLTYFGSNEDFRATTSARATDVFRAADITPTLDKFFGVTRTVGPYSYSISGSPGRSATTFDDPAYRGAFLSGTTGGSLQFAFDQPVRAVSLRVLTLTDRGEFPLPGSDISLFFVFNTSAETGSFVVDNVDIYNFHGFTSDVDLTGVSVGAFVRGGSQQGAFVSSITLGQIAGAVGGIPEPGTWGLMVAGFGAVGVVARRRRAVGPREAVPA